jgi:hypothetical protein
MRTAFKRQKTRTNQLQNSIIIWPEKQAHHTPLKIAKIKNMNKN